MIYDLDQSLKQLSVDFIDIYFYHRDNTDLPAGELVEIMQDFVESGKIRYYGCSNWSAERIIEADNYAKAKGYRGFVANQMLFNIGSKYMKPFPDDTMISMDDKMYSYHTNNPQNLAMPYFGVCSGFFHRAEKEELAALSNSPYYTTQNIELIGRIKTLREKYNASISQIVLGFFYTQAFSIAPLYGPYDVPQLIDAMKVMDIPFDPDDFKI
jgi:aryl-alcohol dehydrogenase-like predicted oxidoreductase